jgi:hypothetical protein
MSGRAASADRASRGRAAYARVSGLGRVRCSTRVWGRRTSAWWLDPEVDQLPAEDLRSRQLVAAETAGPGRSTSIASPSSMGLDGWAGARSEILSQSGQ